MSLDLGTKRVGVAISDELRLTIRPLPALPRSSWKRLVNDLKELRRNFDVKTIVIGLPLRLDGTEGDAALDAQRIADKLSLSLDVPVHMQDERLTSKAAEERLRQAGYNRKEISARVDSEAAVFILQEYFGRTGG
ncbi:MAG: Holliday junction resolvase RuvX [Pyrinomonadaceae bacterium]